MVLQCKTQMLQYSPACLVASVLLDSASKVGSKQIMCIGGNTFYTTPFHTFNQQNKSSSITLPDISRIIQVI